MGNDSTDAGHEAGDAGNYDNNKAENNGRNSGKTSDHGTNSDEIKDGSAGDDQADTDNQITRANTNGDNAS